MSIVVINKCRFLGFFSLLILRINVAFTSRDYLVRYRQVECLRCGATDKSKENAQVEKNGGFLKNYKFGDISKSIAKKISGKKENENYAFGDITKSIAKQVTGDDEYDYEFGDLSRWIDSRVKENANEFTGNDSYKFGDVTVEITKRLKSGDYKIEDIVFLCRILVQFGAGLSPVANILPMKLLMEMLNFSLAQEVGDRLVGALTLEVDKRLKKSITGDAEYQLGDLTKRALSQFIGKDEYSFGDISRTVARKWDEKNEYGKGEILPVALFGNNNMDEQAGNSTQYDIDPQILKELQNWDSKCEMYEE